MNSIIPPNNTSLSMNKEKESFCYIHIPFCTSKCKYCRFASFGNIDNLKVNLYVHKLVNEIQASKIDFKNLKSIYFGGGTPSVLNINQLESILHTLKNKYGFTNNIEINIEATPITITKENIIGWKNIGINRISSGVQTLNNKSLIEIGRGEKGDIIKALDNIDDVGFKNVSIDFIIGLPYVKSGEIKKDLKFIFDKYSFIKHVSVYMLEEYYDVPIEIDSKFENITYPDKWDKLGIKEEEYLGEYCDIKDFLETKGFNSYEISNFSKKGYECKHNKAYWNHSEMLAFGLGAHGLVNSERYSNSESFIDYYAGKNIIKEPLYDNDIFIEKIIFGLRTSGLGEELYNKLNKNKIEEFITEGLLTNNLKILKLTNKGVLLIDYVIKELL